MHYLKKTLLLTCLFVLSISCEKEQTIKFSEVHISSKNDSIVQINIPKAIGKGSIISTINSGIENSVSSSMQIGASKKTESINESITSFVNEYETFKNDFPNSSQIWEAQIDGEVLYQTNQIISISISSYSNTGGAHGIFKISFLNFNTDDGSIIPNEALFNDIEAFKELAKPYYQKSVEGKEIFLNEGSFNLPNNIAYTEDGLILLYNTYEIAAYSEGIIEFKIPLNEAKPYLAFNKF